MKPDFAQYGFLYPDNLIQAFIGGSQLHGAKVGATDDTDWYGVFIEPPEKMIGLDRDEFFVFTTGGKRGGNGPDGRGGLVVGGDQKGLGGDEDLVAETVSLAPPGA